LALAIGGALAFAVPGAAATTTTSPGLPSFTAAISPEYTTAGQPTTFRLTVANTSAPGTTLGSVKVTPPAGFTPPQPTPGAPLRGKAHVRNHTLALLHISLKPGSRAHLSFTATAPSTCGRTLLHWHAQGFQGATGSGAQLAIQAALSEVGITVLCPSTSACGNQGQPCTTSLVTSNSSYAVVSNAPSGTLQQTVNVGKPLTCGSYRFRDPNWYDSAVVSPTTGPTTSPPTTPIVDTVTYTIRNATSSGVGFCLGVGYPFTTASGNPAPAGTLPNGKPGFIGLLPMCANGKPPCISSIAQRPDPKVTAGSDAFMKIQIPETGDPWGAG
jgi:hypothetical protein